MIKTTYKTITTSLLALSLFACQESTVAEPAATAPEQVQTQSQRLTADDLPHYLERSVNEEVFYFVLPDRFYNGDTDNDNGSKTKLISQGGFDPTDFGMYHGGDVPGLKAKIPYLKEMGISAIWLTPILRNQAVQADGSGYHGYWVLDFTEIDPHLGTNDDLKAFINAAHKENIKVYFDIITNHTADVIKFTECHGEDGLTPNPSCKYRTLAEVEKMGTYTPVIPKGSENAKVPAWLNDPKYYHNQGETTFKGEDSVYGDFAGLDDVNTDDPEVVAGMIDIFKNLVTEFKPDGFRIDTVKHVNIEFWQSFAPAIVAHAKTEGIPQFFMFGEVYDFTPKNLSKFTTEGKMQSVLDFALQGAIHKALVEQKGTDELANLFAQDDFYKDSDSDANQLLTFISNHDMGRFAWMLKNSDKNYSMEEMEQRVDLAHAILYFARGIPVVYYGDEQGFVGDGGDKASRQNMMPSKVDSYNDDDLLATDKTTADDNFDKSHPFYQSFAEYASVYFANEGLRKGQQATVYSQATPGIFAVTRTFNDDKYLVLFNTSNENSSAQFALTGKTLTPVFSRQVQNQAVITNNQANASLSPLSVAIYKVN